MENIYLHAINPEEGFWDTKKTLTIAEQILKDGAILTRRNLEANGHYPNSKNTPVGFNGRDYISLADYSKRTVNQNNPFYKGYSAYTEYVKHSVSFGFDPSLEVIKPKIVKPKLYDTRFLSREEITKAIMEMEKLGLSEEERYTDLPDEVQYKGNLSLDKLIGLTIHIRTISIKSNNPKATLLKLKTLIKELQALLKTYQQNVLLYDLETLLPIENEDDVEKTMRKYTLF